MQVPYCHPSRQLLTPQDLGAIISQIKSLGGEATSHHRATATPAHYAAFASSEPIYNVHESRRDAAFPRFFIRSMAAFSNSQLSNLVLLTLVTAVLVAMICHTGRSICHPSAGPSGFMEWYVCWYQVISSYHLNSTLLSIKMCTNKTNLSDRGETLRLGCSSIVVSRALEHW